MAIALDVSGSMHGVKLQHAKTACQAVAGLLRPVDRLWLSGFSTAVTEILHSEQGGRRACEKARDGIASLQASGITRTDLALQWIRDALKPEPGVSRAGILITDGKATDLHGTPMTDVQPLVAQAAGLGGSGITLYAVGMGDAAHFHTPFLTDLADRGRGEFMYARDPAQLESKMRERLASAQAFVVDQAVVVVKPQRPGVTVGPACRFRPSFAPLEAIGGTDVTSYAVGALTANQPTDVLMHVRAHALPFGERLGTYAVAEVAVQGGGSTSKAMASLEWTNSLVSAQTLNQEVDRDRLMWDVNLYADALQRTDDQNRTGELLKQIADTANAAGRQDVANRATTDLDELVRKGVHLPDRKTTLLEDARKTSGAA